jgi:hypothetical protein
MRLSQRDLRVIVKCGVAKCLTTGQVQRLCFPAVTPDAVRKSLRRLAEARCLASFREHRMTEALHGLGTEGVKLLAARGMALEPLRAAPRQADHVEGINDVRVAVEAEPARLAYFFAAWELQRLGWTCPLIPDAVFALRRPERRTFAIEYDRGTENAEVFRRKLVLYREGIPGLDLHALVILTDDATRLQVIRRQVRDAPRLRIYGSLILDLRTLGVSGAIFSDLLRPEQAHVSLFAAAE